MIDRLKAFLTHPLIRGANIDAPETVACISQIIRGKPFLKNIYQHWYMDISKLLPNGISGSVLELGSGAGFLEEYISNLIKSEVLQTSGVNIVLDAHHLPYSKEKLRGIVMIDVLHHLANAEYFFREASYCIKPGGMIVMIEPWVTCWSKFVYRKLHHEPFNDIADQWIFPKGGPLSQANSALPWIIFHRDKTIFLQKFPEWKIKQITLHTPFTYLLSGGVSLRSLLPGFSLPCCRLIEHLMNPWMKSLAMFATIGLERTKR